MLCLVDQLELKDHPQLQVHLKKPIIEVKQKLVAGKRWS